jgi:hypothetical protein
VVLCAEPPSAEPQATTAFVITKVVTGKYR